MLQDPSRERAPAELAARPDMTPEKAIELQTHGREPIRAVRAAVINLAWL
jgi:hypothetical protein